MSANGVVYKFDKAAGILTAKSNVMTRECRIGVTYSKKNPGAYPVDVKVQDIVDDMIVVESMTGTHAGKRRLVECKAFFLEYGDVIERKPGVSLGNPDLPLGAGGKGTTVQLLLAEQRETNRLLRELLAVWTHDSANGVPK